VATHLTAARAQRLAHQPIDRGYPELPFDVRQGPTGRGNDDVAFHRGLNGVGAVDQPDSIASASPCSRPDAATIEKHAGATPMCGERRTRRDGPRHPLVATEGRSPPRMQDAAAR